MNRYVVPRRVQKAAEKKWSLRVLSTIKSVEDVEAWWEELGAEDCSYCDYFICPECPIRDNKRDTCGDEYENLIAYFDGDFDFDLAEFQRLFTAMHDRIVATGKLVKGQA